MRTVVTGSAGFIGRTLVRELGEYGSVIGIDRAPQEPMPGLERVDADLLDHDPDVRDALGEADVVFHLAGCPDVRDPRPDADRWRYRDNVQATEAVLNAVPRRTRLIVASSSSVYGGSLLGRPSAESDRLRPRGGYARSKVAMEQVCARRRADGAPILVVRPFTVAGEGQRPGMGLARWIAAARSGEPLTVLGAPDRSRDLTDVRQLARALVELAEMGATGTVNLGTGRGHTLGEIAEAVGRVLDVDIATEVRPAADVEVAHTLADTRRLRSWLGWVPRTDLDDLIARQVAATPAADPVGRAATPLAG